MADKFQVSYKKTLKLQNVLVRETLSVDEMEEIQKNLIMMENYIKSKGSMPIGPLVQYSSPGITESGQMFINTKYLRQCNTYINKVEKPYIMESVIRVPDCLYVRYTGPEDKLDFAYEKLHLIAFEEELHLKGDSYTVFLELKDGIMTADIFMEYDYNE